MPQIPGGFELILILAVVLLLFGGKKIPQLAKGLGEGIRNFKKSVKEEDSTETEVASTDEPKKVEGSEANVEADAPKTTEKQA